MLPGAGGSGGRELKDDDEELLRNQTRDQFEYLEVAHIIPHFLATVSSEESELVSDYKGGEQVLGILLGYCAVQISIP